MKLMVEKIICTVLFGFIIWVVVYVAAVYDDLEIIFRAVLIAVTFTMLIFGFKKIGTILFLFTTAYIIFTSSKLLPL